MKKQFTFLLIFLSSVCIKAQWVQKANTTGSTRSGAVSWSINGKLYVAGGGPGQSLEEYNPVTNTWTVKAAFPWTGYRYLSMGFVINGKGYVCSGTDGSGTYLTDLWMYDPALNTWTARANFTGSARVLAFSFGIGNKGYVGCGGDNQVFFNDVYEYDATVDSWSQKSNFPGGYRAHLVGTSLGGFGYAGAGVSVSTSGGLTFVNHSDLFQYDPSHDSWNPVTDIPGPPRLSAISFASDSLIYAGLGSNSQDPNSGTDYGDMYAYNPELNQWDTLATLATGRCQATGAFVSGQPYITTGRNNTAAFGDLWTINKTSITTGLQDHKQESGVRVYPSPAKDKLTFSMNGESAYVIKMTTVTGEIVLQQNNVNNELTLDCSTLADGVYLLTVSGEKNSRSIKVIVNHD